MERIFQSTPPARGATLTDKADTSHLVISIHAPREGGDYTAGFYDGQLDISIHAPREGGDQLQVVYPVGLCQFQSTPPARGATI